MLITKAVSTYKCPALLREALASIAAQTYADFKAAPEDCPERRALKLAVKLLLPHNNDLSHVH